MPLQAPSPTSHPWFFAAVAHKRLQPKGFKKTGTCTSAVKVCEPHPRAFCYGTDGGLARRGTPRSRYSKMNLHGRERFHDETQAL